MTDRHACARCAVDFDPARTDGACPVCRTPAPGHDTAAPGRGLDLSAFVVGVSAVDLLVLAGAAWWLFG